MPPKGWKAAWVRKCPEARHADGRGVRARGGFCEFAEEKGLHFNDSRDRGGRFYILRMRRKRRVRNFSMNKLDLNQNWPDKTSGGASCGQF